MMRVHRLKTLGQYFDAVASGKKTFEIRVNDRGYEVGDILELVRYEMRGAALEQTSMWRPIRRRVTYIIHGPAYGLATGYCIMALELLPLTETDTCHG